MPKVTPEETRIARAIEAIRNGEVPTLVKAHHEYHVPYFKLHARLNGRKSLASNGGFNKALDKDQEAVLCRYIDRCVELGRPAKKRLIQMAANSILQAANSDRIVSKAWVARFNKRQHVNKHRTRPLSAQRKAAHKIDDIHRHFADFESRFAELEVKPENIWNFDESGFRIGCLAGQIVFTRTDKPVYMADPENRELITSMECINAIGQAIQPMIIMSGVVMKEKHFDNDLDERVLFAMSESGYTNDVLTFEWLKHFENQTWLLLRTHSTGYGNGP